MYVFSDDPKWLLRMGDFTDIGLNLYWGVYRLKLAYAGWLVYAYNDIDGYREGHHDLF